MPHSKPHRKYYIVNRNHLIKMKGCLFVCCVADPEAGASLCHRRTAIYSVEYISIYIHRPFRDWPYPFHQLNRPPRHGRWKGRDTMDTFSTSPTYTYGQQVRYHTTVTQVELGTQINNFMILTSGNIHECDRASLWWIFGNN